MERVGGDPAGGGPHIPSAGSYGNIQHSAFKDWEPGKEGAQKESALAPCPDSSFTFWHQWKLTRLTCPDMHDAFEETRHLRWCCRHIQAFIIHSVAASLIWVSSAEIGEILFSWRRWTTNCICSKYRRHANILIRKPVSANFYLNIQGSEHHPDDTQMQD